MKGTKTRQPWCRGAFSILVCLKGFVEFFTFCLIFVWRSQTLAKWALFSDLVRKKQKMSFPNATVFFLGSASHWLITRLHKDRWRRLAYRIKVLEKNFYSREVLSSYRKSTRSTDVHWKHQKVMEKVKFSIWTWCITQILTRKRPECLQVN